MEKVILIFWVLVLGSECCLAQASATATVSATIIDERALIKDAGYEHLKLSPADKSRIVDSMQTVKDMKIVNKKRADRRRANNFDVPSQRISLTT